MSLGTRFQATAARLITKHGKDVTVIGPEATPKNQPTKVWRGSSGTSSVVVKAVQYPYEAEELPDRPDRSAVTRFIVAENSVAGVSQFSSVDLVKARTISYGEMDWSVDNVEIIEPGAERILYLVEASH